MKAVLKNSYAYKSTIFFGSPLGNRHKLTLPLKAKSSF